MSTVGVALVLFTIQLGVLSFFLVVFGLSPDWQALWLLPLAFVALVVFTCAVSIFLSAVNVYLRDTQHLTEVLLMAWFWATPIVYPYGLVAPHLGQFHITGLYFANPLAPIAMSFQRAIYGQTSYTYLGVKYPLLPTTGLAWYALALGIVILVSAGLFLLSLIVFGRLEGNFAEEL
jgi:ABC-2 type transport system permease protein